MESEIRNVEQLFKSKEWISVKMYQPQTERILTKIEWLKEVGWQNYSEEKYREYLRVMNEKEFGQETIRESRKNYYSNPNPTNPNGIQTEEI